MRDGIELARRGVAAVMVLPQALVPLAQEKARLFGMPDFPLAVLERTLYGRTPEEIRADSAAVGEAITGAIVERRA